VKNIEFVATLPVAQRPALEDLFFFNPRQPDMRDQIISTVNALGVPTIVENGGRVWIGVPFDTTQCLFACEVRGTNMRPVGVAIYSRPEPAVIWISHLAVVSSRTREGQEIGLSCLLVGQIRLIASQIQGVTKIRLPYRESCFLSVRKAPPMPIASGPGFPGNINP
jgi:hypothetical protein